MKKLLIACLILLFAFGAHALEWRSTNQATISWDAVATLTDGTPLPAGNTVKYRVYMANAVTDPSKANPALLGETDLLEHAVTLNVEGKYFVGVSAVRFDAGVEVSESVINWSDVNGEATPNPFGLVFFHPPSTPLNLK